MSTRRVKGLEGGLALDWIDAVVVLVTLYGTMALEVWLFGDAEDHWEVGGGHQRPLWIGTAPAYTLVRAGLCLRRAAVAAARFPRLRWRHGSWPWL